MEIPTEWPNKIKELYEPIRILGKGGFASVVLARNKKNNKQQPQQHQTKVAIKVVGCAANDNDDDNNNNASIQAIAAASLYAQREIEILEQIDHPNIVKLFNHWVAGVDDDDDDDNNGDNTSSLITKTTAAVLVLEYVKGPTVESLLRYGGALSTIFGRIIIAQMMDAVSYLHYHAVLHRDIKPDNILVSGAISNDNSIWDNNPNNNANNSNNNNNENDDNNDNDELDEQCHHHHSSYSSSGGTTSTTTAKYRELLLKWKVTIIDFGFARALTPNDVERPSQENRLKHSKNASYHDIYNINSSSNSSNNNNNKSNNYTDELSSSSSKRLRQRISRGILNVLDVSFHRDSNDLSSSQRSATHKIKRTMSTLGNRNYAAPEIINKVRPRNHREEKKKKEKAEQKRSTIKVTATATSAISSHGTTATATNTNTNTNTAMTTETISNYVADYGLLVDSYSMGHTIRYMMTGVQPGTSIDDAIQKQQNIENGLLCCRKLLFCFSNKNKKQQQPQKRSVRYRQTEDLPGEVYILIRSLTELSQRNRISIRKARRTVPWISDVFLSSSQQQQEQQLSLSLSNKEDDNSNNNSNNDDDERKKEQPQNIISTLPTTTTTTISTPSSHYAVSEEQLHSLNQICYLSLGTAAIEIVAAASNHPTTSPTKLDTDIDTSINTNTHTSTSTNTSTDKTSIVQIDTDDITTTEQTIVEQQHDETLMF